MGIRGTGRRGPFSLSRGERIVLLWSGLLLLGSWGVILASGIDGDDPTSAVPLAGLVLVIGVLWRIRRRAAAPRQGAALLPPLEPRSGGFLQRLHDRIDPPQPPDPEAWVVLTVVPFSDGPMIHSAIEGAGIVAVMDEVRPIPAGLHGAYGMARHRIVVRQRDHDEAAAILRDLLDEAPPDPFDAL